MANVAARVVVVNPWVGVGGGGRVGACVGSSFVSDFVLLFFPFALTPGHGVSSSAAQSGVDLTRKRGSEPRNHGDGDNAWLTPHRRAFHHTRFFDALLNVEAAHRIFRIDRGTARTLVPWPS